MHQKYQVPQFFFLLHRLLVRLLNFIQSAKQGFRIVLSCFIHHFNGGECHVQQPDGGIRQTAVFHIPLGKAHAFGDSLLADFYMVVVHILFLYGVQHLNGGLHVRLIDLYHLKTAVKGMVRLDDLTVFVNGGGTYHGQVAMRQFGFQHISGTRISLPAIQQYMDFINKQDGVVRLALFQ